MSFLRYALVTVPAILLLGTVSGRASGAGAGNAWFEALIKPDFMPPGWLFGLAWTILYILMGLAFAMILHARGAKGRGLAIGLFLVQLLLNFAWSPVFFGMHRVGAALVVAIAMLLLAAATTLLFARIRSAAAWLMVPYVAWLVFASVLTWQIYTLNPHAEELVPQQGSADIPL
jgi:tryptophan-rich sensory protein